MKKRKRYMKNQMGIFLNAKLFAFLAVLVIALAIPITLNLLNQNTYHPSLAVASTTLSFAQPSVTGNAGSNVSLDLMLNPGTNLVSTITLYVTYDGSVIKAASNGFVPGDGTPSFPPCSTPTGLLCVFDGPTYDTCTGNQCTMYIVLSIGNDFTKAIKTTTKIATLNFVAQANGVSQVGFDPQTQILSIASTDSPGENVLQSSTPAAVNIGNVPVTITPQPTSSTGSGSPTPTPSNGSPTPTGNPSNQPTTNPSKTPKPTIQPSPTGAGNKCDDDSLKKREKKEDIRENNEMLREQKFNHDFQLNTGNHHGGCLGAYDPNNPNSNVNCNDNGSGGIIPANQNPNGTPSSFWDWALKLLGVR